MPEAPKYGRWSFSLRALLAAAAAAALVSLGVRAYLRQDSLEGTWQGTGADARYSARFTGNTLSIQTGSSAVTAPRQSWFKVDADNGLIDIQRDDGVQLGRYAVKGDTLTLKLADPNAPRPKDLDPVDPPHGERRYQFKRVR
jgi:hypothetical protein